MPYKDPERKRLHELAQRQASPELYREKNRRYREAHRKEIREQKRQYQREHLAERAAYMRRWWAERSRTPQGHAEHVLRLQLWRALHGKGDDLLIRGLVGCSASELRARIESLFLPGMTWKNHNRHGWHVDHVIPCSAFDLTDSAQRAECFHHSNLRPLWAFENCQRANGQRLRMEDLQAAAVAEIVEAAR